MKNEGVKLLTEHFSRWQLVILFVMVVAFTYPLRDRVFRMLGIQPAGVESILASGAAAGVIAWATAFVMLCLTSKRHVEPPQKK